MLSKLSTLNWMNGRPSVCSELLKWRTPTSERPSQSSSRLRTAAIVGQRVQSWSAAAVCTKGCFCCVAVYAAPQCRQAALRPLLPLLGRVSLFGEALPGALRVVVLLRKCDSRSVRDLHLSLSPGQARPAQISSPVRVQVPGYTDNLCRSASVVALRTSRLAFWPVKMLATALAACPPFHMRILGEF